MAFVTKKLPNIVGFLFLFLFIFLITYFFFYNSIVKSGGYI